MDLIYPNLKGTVESYTTRFFMLVLLFNSFKSLQNLIYMARSIKALAMKSPIFYVQPEAYDVLKVET